MSKHTPGPWTTSRDAVPTGHVQVTVYTEGTGRRVATAFESEANAHLIGAAPELLAACEAMLSWVDCGCDPSLKSMADARSAIAKATGNQ